MRLWGSRGEFFMSHTDTHEQLTLASFQELFNKELKRYLAEKSEAYRALIDTPLVIETLDHAVSLITQRGKRIRPYMCFLAYTTESGISHDDAIRIGIALELFHSFALIHDDIIDRGVERHGAMTTHRYVGQTIASYPRGDKTHIAEAMAMLAGDLIFSWAYEIILSAGNSRIQEIFLTMIQEVVVGQMLDVSLMLEYTVSRETIKKKNDLKTSLYSFVNPMLIGAALAGTDTHTGFYRELGLLLGQAFQIQDDLLDIVGEKRLTGKEPFIDIQDGQHTLITQYVFEQGSDEEKDTLRTLFGTVLDTTQKEILKNLFISSGAVVEAQKKITALFDRANECVSQAHISTQQKVTWAHLITMLNARRL